VRIVEYDASRRGEVADLMARVWGERPAEAELEWFYERNPVRPASVLLGEDEGQVMATVAISFQRMSIGGEELEVGMPLRVATDAAYRGRGIFGQLQAANEERVRDLGVRLLLTVPNAASASVFLQRLGWQRLPPLRVWARPKLLPSRLKARRVERFDHVVTESRNVGPARDRVVRDEAWLNWRFAEAPRDYTLLDGDGYAVVGRRGRVGVVAAVEGGLLGDAAAAARAPVLIAAPPPWQRSAYLLAGFGPTPRTFTVLGKALADGQAIPPHPHFELGDLDFL
jgi:GNAT superfamily N-acetyltransferase